MNNKLSRENVFWGFYRNYWSLEDQEVGNEQIYTNQYDAFCYCWGYLKQQLKQKDKQLKIAMDAVEFGSKLNSYSDAVNTRYKCNEAKQQIQSILKGELWANSIQGTKWE